MCRRSAPYDPWMIATRAISVGMLGPLQVHVSGHTLGPEDLGGRKPKQVLEILLVHRGSAVAKDRLADLLWRDELPTDPMRTLEAYVSVVRRALGREVGRRLVVTGQGSYRLDEGVVDLDLDRFDQLVETTRSSDAAGRLDLRRRALELMRGEVLADEPYADWVGPIRRLYEERWLALLLDTAEDCLATSRPEEAAELASQVLEAEPTRERAHRLLMTARYAAGDQAHALEAYDRCRTVLDEELGVRPLPRTEQVFRGVLDQRPASSLLPSPAAAVPGGASPPVRFARNGGTTIAYQVIGDGPLDVVFAHGWFSHAEIGWEEPRYAGWLQRLARGRRVIVFDRRGMGMSDPAPATVTLAERADDMSAVLDAVGSERAVAFGSCGAGPMTIALATREPERVAGLALFGTFARLLAAPGYPSGWTPEFFAAYCEGLEQGWATGRGIAKSVPSAGPDEQLMEWLARLLRLSVSPAAARAILEFGASIDVRSALGAVRVPTLVLHRRGDQWVDPGNGRYLAEHIPDARLVELSGADHWPWFGDAESVLRPLETFLDTVAAGRRSNT
jgi:DNA-binding SARP family transcriptional activator/pimeloyl-ACP methyl ester carboxylesterase